jgi:RecA-family ATPase
MSDSVQPSATGVLPPATHDLDAAERLLSLIAEGDTVIFQTFDETGQKRGALTRVLPGDISDLGQQLVELNDAGAGVFWTVNRTDGNGRRTENITGIRAVFVDLDGAPIGPVENCAAEPHAIIESSSGRFHAYWAVIDCPLDQFGTVQRELAKKFDGDQSVTDLPRVMRLPGFVHRKAEPFTTRIRALNASQPYTLAELVARLNLDLRAVQGATKQVGTALSDAAGVIGQGGRHKHLERMVGRLNSAGINPDSIDAAVQFENSKRCSPPLEPAEVSETVRAMLRRYHGQHGSAERAAPSGDEFDAAGVDCVAIIACEAGKRAKAALSADAGLAADLLDEAQALLASSQNDPRGGPAAAPSLAAAEALVAAAREHAGTAIERVRSEPARETATSNAPPFAVVPFADLRFGAPPPPSYWWQGIVPAGVVTLMGAHGGVGKSTIALMLAVCIATGRPLFGIDTRRGRVAFFNGEDGADLVRHRLHWICQKMEIDVSELEGWLYVLDATEGEPTLYAEERGRSGKTTPTYAALATYTVEHEIDVLIVDNASDTFDANEIERARVRQYMRALGNIAKHRAGAVLLLAHVDKQTSKAGKAANGEGYSGSTAWHNSARSRLFVERVEDGRLVIEHQKSNLGALHKPLKLEWLPNQLPEVEHPTSSVVENIQRRNDLKAVLKLLHEYTERGESVSTGITSRTHAGKLFRREPSFPKMSDHELFDLLRRAEREKLLAREEYKALDRHMRERWSLTDAGLVYIGAATSVPRVDEGGGDEEP